ncbi:MAG: B12-binding domain-containing radical SAM protein [Deltaproteobacteria bacterium]|nr:B12-binding domain-containing radical SAM protein [Deltaproteobacteria bacterium]
MNSFQRILLVFPNLDTLMPNVFPTDLGALSAYLKQFGYETRIHIVNTHRLLREFQDELRAFEPDVVGITGIGSQALYMKELATASKAWRRDVPVICGGKNASIAPDTLINYKDIDVVCVGEGEYAFRDYLQALNDGADPTGIKNLWFRTDGEPIKNPCRSFVKDLDSLPFWDYDAVDYQAMIDFNYRWVMLLAGRGCPGICTFCGVPPQAHLGEGEFCRLRSVEHVLGEIEMLERKYKFDHIYFRDDTFTWNRQWAMEWAEKYAAKFAYPYEILTRADCLDHELMDALKASNCAVIWLGADSGNDYIRNEILKKGCSNERLIEVCDYLHEIGIRPHLTNMVGLPHETPEMHRETIELNRRVYSRRATVSPGTGPSPMIFVFSPFPGSSLWEMSAKEGWLRGHWRGFRTYRESVIDMPQFPAKDVRRAQRKFRYEVYRTSHPVWAWFLRIADSGLVQKARNVPAVNRLSVFSMKWVSAAFMRRDVQTAPSPVACRHPSH